MNDRELIKAALVYKSGEDSYNTVYMGCMATAAVYGCFGLSYASGDLTKAIDEGTDEQIAKAKEVCQSVIDYMLENPVTRCPCCGQIVRRKR